MQSIFKKPKDMTYTAMCIWIDENIYKEDCDMNKAYEYMWLISYMLACKKRYFSSEREYEEFSSMFAYSTYQRMTNPQKSKVKSVLNYMKSTISFRRMSYESSHRHEIIDPKYTQTFDSAMFSEQYRSTIESSNREIIVNHVNDLIKSIPTVIYNSIPKVYKSNDLIKHNLYVSSLLSMINKFTIPSNYEARLVDKLNSPTFDEVKFYKKHLDDEIILWHLDSSMENVVRVILNKVSKRIITEIKEICNDALISQEDFCGIMSSAYESGGKNETTY